MTHVDVFESSRLRAVWYDTHGLLKAYKPEPRPKRPKRQRDFIATFLGGVALSMGMLVDAVAAAEPPSQGALAWPTAKWRLSVQEALQDSLKKIRALKPGWNREAPAPVERAISVAEYILPQLPDVPADARAGVDDQGNVFLRLHRGDRVAYLTVEPKVMHLVYMEAGQPNVYIDDAEFSGKILPLSIKKVLDERLKS
jgi:hypothetical protein